MNFYSQCGEDRWIAENLFGDGHRPPLHRTFCEVGAFDGVTFSNTKAFEEAGWKGICIEANPALAAECSGNRTCPVWCCAVGAADDFGTFHVNQVNPDLSGLEALGRPVPVLIKRLDWLLAFAALPNLDLLSIDTEGTELEVWKSIGAIRPRVVVMEHLTGVQPSKADEIVERMGRDGYREIHRTAYNLILTTDSH